MMRTCLAAAFVALVLSVLLHGARDRTRQFHQDITRLEALIAREHETIRVLDAEWSFRVSPGRLHKQLVIHKDELADHGIALRPIAARQVGSFDAIPRRQTPETAQ